MQREDFEQQLTALLRDTGPDTVAELTDTAIAYWNGERLVYADVSAEGTGALAGNSNSTRAGGQNGKDGSSTG